MACYMEEVCSKSSMKMQDKEETTCEASCAAVTKGEENEVWRLEPSGEAESLLGNTGKRKTKYACVVGADESMRIRLEGIPQRYHKNHITAKGMNSMSH